MLPTYVRSHMQIAKGNAAGLGACNDTPISLSSCGPRPEPIDYIGDKEESR